MVNQIKRPTMPRKPRDHEPTILRIEGLSGGEAHTAQSQPSPAQPNEFIDDFTGQPIPLMVPETKPKPPEPTAPDHRQLKRDGEAHARLIGLSMLVRLGIEKDRPDPFPPEPPKPKPPHVAHNQALLGKDHIITFINPNAFKRRM